MGGETDEEDIHSKSGPAAKKKGYTVYNADWVKMDNFSEWVRPTQGDPFSATCILWPAKIVVQHEGRFALDTHEKTKKHQTAMLMGLGLGDAKDITVKGLEVVKSCSRVYLEAYTSILTVGKEALEEYYGRELILADRGLVELEAEEILKEADTSDVAFLVVGDPFGATTHSDLVLRAVHAGISYRVVHNASIMNAVGCCGLQLYSFGETVSIVFWADDWRPESFYDKIKKNRSMGLHSLCLLDIKVKEQSIENLMRGRKVYEPPRFMSVSQAAQQLLEIIQKRREEGEELGLSEDTVCVGVARVGAEDQVIRTATLRQLGSCDLGPPLHSLIVTGRLHPLEVDMLRLSAAPDALTHLEVVDSSTSTS